uniref:Uncharacterized protein n=1 Tax=Arion vulgaris TaxID=1028688 RepID=A0A0B6YU99_9EUPU
MQGWVRVPITMQTVLTQVQLPLILISLSLYVIHTHGSPLSDSNNSSCPRGWVQYEQFCVTRGEGSSDMAVALYCDGFGGIGIKGLCIIKRSKLELSSPVDIRSDTSSDTDVVMSPYSDFTLRDSASSVGLDMDVFSNSFDADDDVCPKGWTHYRSMCVYKPWSTAATCHLMNSVEFHGLCVKHADTEPAANRDLRGVNRKEKRICCCANFKARGNNYGC